MKQRLNTEIEHEWPKFKSECAQPRNKPLHDLAPKGRFEVIFNAKSIDYTLSWSVKRATHVVLDFHGTRDDDQGKGRIGMVSIGCRSSVYFLMP